MHVYMLTCRLRSYPHTVFSQMQRREYHECVQDAKANEACYKDPDGNIALTIDDDSCYCAAAACKDLVACADYFTTYRELGVTGSSLTASGEAYNTFGSDSTPGPTPTPSVDPCSLGNGGCSQICSSTDQVVTCSCNEGFFLEEDGVTCADIDECTNGQNNCDPNATCTNEPGTFSCSCNSGYEGDGVTCTQPPECIAGGQGLGCDAGTQCCAGVGRCSGGKPSSRTCLGESVTSPTTQSTPAPVGGGDGLPGGSPCSDDSDCASGNCKGNGICK